MRLTDFADQHRRQTARWRSAPCSRSASALWKFHAAADGQMGCILKLYREWLLSRRSWSSSKLI